MKNDRSRQSITPPHDGGHYICMEGDEEILITEYAISARGKQTANKETVREAGDYCLMEGAEINNPPMRKGRNQ